MVVKIQSEKEGFKKIIGLIERVTFHNPENGFCVLKVKLFNQKDKELLPVLGSIPSIYPGEQLEAIGYYEHNDEHGLQFRADSIKTTAPTSIEGIERYLGSGLIKGIGPAFARALVNEFKEEIFNVIELKPEELTKVTGIGQRKLSTIIKSFNEQKIVREIVLFLHSFGVSTSRALKIYQEYGAGAIEIIKENPYKLAEDIRGIGFKSADTVALNLGVEPHSITRARAGINHALVTAMSSGHCGLPTNQLIELGAKLLEVSESLIKEALDLELKEKTVVKDVIELGIGRSSNNNEISQSYNNYNEFECIFLKGFAHSEKAIAQTLYNSSFGKLAWKRFSNVPELIQSVTSKIDISLSNTQKQAIEQALESRVMIITGGPGVGKTTLINTIIKILQTKDVDILLAAPTGRAARRMSETTGLAASTIHRMIRRKPDEDYKAQVTLKCDLLILDEASMIDVSLMYSVLRALPERASIFLVGDVDQLPSVGSGRVLGDLIDSQAFSCVKLTEIFRQSKMSKIITNAHSINKGYLPSLMNQKDSDFFFIEVSSPEEALSTIVDLVQSRILNKYGFCPLKDIQVLCPMTKGTVGTKSLNHALQKALISDIENNQNSVQAFGIYFYVGDKVMQIVNNYDLDVFNGDIGFISTIDIQQQQLIVTYQYGEAEERKITYEFKGLDELVHAYATTVHKSQGSEYSVVIVPILMQHYPMLQRNLLYTAITRGKKLVIVVGEKKALSIAISNRNNLRRFTSLYTRLLECMGMR